MEKKLLVKSYNYELTEARIFENSSKDSEKVILQKTFDIYECHVKNAFVLPHGPVFKNGILLSDSVHQGHRYLPYYLSFYKKQLLGNHRNFDTPAFVIHHGWHDNYYHWLLEILPRLYLIRDKIKGRKLIINHHLSSFQLKTLSFFEFNGFEIVSDSEMLFVSDVLFTTVAVKDRFHNPKLIKEMADYMSRKVMEESIDNEFGEYIYISRRNAERRKILNEAEFLRVVSEHGFRDVCLEDLSMDAQIEVFSRAKVVLAIHGAGIANTIFSKAGTLVIELIHKNHHNYCFHNLCSAMNIPHFYLVCEGTENHPNPAFNDIYVDLKALSSALGKIDLIKKRV